ncbi:MAG: putative baseplate assembly protein [Stellaceae bacterium]
MSDSGDMPAPCGCCIGVARETPAAIFNRAGLSSIAYRAGTHASFKASMLAALSDPAFPALAPLTARDDSDFSIALLDAFAVAADILTFYQERLANESYLRTAVQQRSVNELARLVGYQPGPGVAASAPLAFTLNEASGSPDPVVIDAGSRVQSVPAPGQQPAVFETEAPLTARIAYNALPVETSSPVSWQQVTTSLWLTGTATGLKPGDTILLVDKSRLGNPPSEVWELRGVTAVTPDPANNRTRIDWDQGLFTTFQQGAADVQVYAMRKRASLFGVNAPDPSILPSLPSTGLVLRTAARITEGTGDWNFIHDNAQADLDTVYPDIAPTQADAGQFDSAPERFSWLVLSFPDAHSNFRKLYRIVRAADRAPLRYTLSFKTTSLTLDTDNDLDVFVKATRQTTAFVQSEPLVVAEQPLIAPIDGHALGSGTLTPVAGDGATVLGGGMLNLGQTIAVIGKRIRLQLDDDPAATLLGSDGRTSIALAAGDVLLADAYPPVVDAGRATWQVLTTKGVAGTLTVAEGAITLIAADKADPDISEAAVIAGIDPRSARTELGFARTLGRIYDRATVRFNANVVAADHGETVKELLGSGDSSVANQRFTLKQAPLTYIAVPQGQGTQSTLQVWVNDLQWHEEPNLLGAGPRDRVFETRRNDAGGVIVQFGDGQHGARPPTGQVNIRATYRKGLGSAGMVATGQLSQAIDRPAGLNAVSNPVAASGGADPDTAEEVRRSAPLHVLTLDRVVSLEDYQDFAAAFAGVAKALATWTWYGRTRGVVVTVAGAGGSSLDPDGETIADLAAAMRSAGNPYVPVVVLPHRTVPFQIGGLVRVDETDYDPDQVLAATRAALAQAFGFDARGLGQGVAQSEVVAAIQAVPGVVAVRLTEFSREDVQSNLPEFLIATAPVAGERGIVAGAELLQIDVLSLVGLGRWP